MGNALRTFFAPGKRVLKEGPAAPPPAASASPAAPAEVDWAADHTWRATLGAGCYWGTEKYVRKDWSKRHPGALVDAKVGFMSPHANARSHPSYQEVCSGATGHVEVLEVEVRGPAATYEDLIRFFFTFHDPTTLNRQGNDCGTQYASYIFTYDAAQYQIATRVKAEVQGLLDSGALKGAFANARVSTLVADAADFFPAHQEHQDYLDKNPRGYCNHRIRPAAAAQILPKKS